MLPPTLLLLMALLSSGVEAETVEYSHGYAFLATPKYPADFPHFDYVNPDAPGGGRMRIADMGNWDHFNPI
ncbi:MAG: ABC transporter substrate-binding protein, partial [Pseudomonadales bacterium]|nr:ABC transporter substrate-binding protein [Pseudomonadales bacterium]